jgi:hypothetical protein
MAWVESHQSLRAHPKTRMFARRLGIGIAQAVGHLHCLWWWCLDYADAGDLSRYGHDVIADACEWDGDPSELVEALVGSGFVDVSDQGLHVHDWDDYAGRLIERRRRNAARMKEARASHVSRTCGATQHNSTQPDPTKSALCAPDEPAPSTRTALVTALKDRDWTTEAEELLGRSRFPDLLRRLAEVMAAENKTGAVRTSRVVRELYEPLLALEAEIAPDAMRHGLEEAIRRGAPNKTYVRKAAAGWRPCGAPRPLPATVTYNDVLEST